MTVEWYPDIAFLEAFVLYYIIIRTTKETGIVTATNRRCLVAALGSAAASVCFRFYHLVMKDDNREGKQVLASIAILLFTAWLICFKKSWKEKMRSLLGLFFVTLFYGGICFAVKEHGNLSGAKTYLIVLLLSFCVTTVVIRRMRQRTLENRQLWDVMLEIGGEQIYAKGYYDSGNCLLDPYQGRPVVIVKESLLQCCREKLGSPVLIPYYSLGEEHGMMKAYRAQKLVLSKEKKGKKEYDRVLLAVDEKVFSHQQEYDMILHSSME